MRPEIIRVPPNKEPLPTFGSLQTTEFFESKNGGLYIKIDRHQALCLEPANVDAPVEVGETSPWQSHHTVIPVRVRIEVIP